MIGLYKLECVRRDRPWRGVEDLQLATLSWVHWFNHQRLHRKIGYVPPTEHEVAYYRRISVTDGDDLTAQQPLPGEPALH